MWTTCSSSPRDALDYRTEVESALQASGLMRSPGKGTWTPDLFLCVTKPSRLLPPLSETLLIPDVESHTQKKTGDAQLKLTGDALPSGASKLSLRVEAAGCTDQFVADEVTVFTRFLHMHQGNA